MDDRLGEACGVFGVYAPGQAVANFTYFGLFALQHRGQESAGIAVSDGQTITVVKDMGLVTQVFDERRLAPLEGGWVLASETAGLDIVGAVPVREIEPAEMIVIDASGVRSKRYAEPHPKLCLFEFVYFARPDSELYGQNVHAARQRMGEELARQAPAKADMVMPVPESGIPAAQGFARASGIPYGDGLVKNRYVGRTFIQPNQKQRGQGVRLKLNPLPENIRGKKLVVVDDSIVRGTTTRQVVQMLREAGATEVHLRVSSPPYRWPCFYGMDTGRRSELLAADLSVGEIRNYLGADSLAYLELPRLVAATGAPPSSFCTACLSGEYPVPVVEELAGRA